LNEEQKIPKDEEPQEAKGSELPLELPKGEPSSEPEDLKAKVTELEKSVAFYKDQLLRKAAEFENFKKRAGNEYLAITRLANETLISLLLPVLDDLARSLKVGKTRREFGSFYKGVELIHAKLIKALESQGLKPIDALGKEFNVDYHEALMQIPKEDVPPHMVIEEVEKGYMLNDKVIRHAKVIVSGNSEDKTREAAEETPGKRDETKTPDEKTGNETQ
jgi:molecular chaperone GrpE